MKRYPALLIALAVAASAAVAQVADVAAVSPAPPPAASKLRLFGQNGVGVVLHRNSACDGGADSVRVSGGMGSAFSSFIGTVKNESLGMPETETTRRLAQRDGMMSKAFFKEYEIAPGQPVTVAMGFSDVGMRKQCRNMAATFVPETGAAYEGRLDLDLQAGLCRFVVNRVGSDGALSAVAIEPASTCK